MALGTYSSQISGGSTTWLSQSKIGKSLVTMGGLRGTHCQKESRSSLASLAAERLDHTPRGVDPNRGDEDRQLDAGAAKRPELFPAARHRPGETDGIQHSVTQRSASASLFHLIGFGREPLARKSLWKNGNVVYRPRLARAASRISLTSSPTKVGSPRVISTVPRPDALARPRSIHTLLFLTRSADQRNGMMPSASSLASSTVRELTAATASPSRSAIGVSFPGGTQPSRAFRYETRPLPQSSRRYSRTHRTGSVPPSFFTLKRSPAGPGTGVVRHNEGFLDSCWRNSSVAQICPGSTWGSTRAVHRMASPPAMTSAGSSARRRICTSPWCKAMRRRGCPAAW